MIGQTLHLLTEEQILRVIAKGDENSLILQELSSLVHIYTNLSLQLTAAGKDPAPLLYKEPSCPFDRIAQGMAAAAITVQRKNALLIEPSVCSD